ncbi:sensor histidine kinase [Spirochaeta cellobiosiphila]|uniref:sensor histidine kinase n=1 Tax=Spirochaeta cellobiosiphila TaxID=504483 RepID=UPI000402A7B9|nr:sensor histidine kinase [Spirochaeta cellobiosiphila]
MKVALVHKNNMQNAIRLISVFLYFLFLTPGLLLPPRKLSLLNGRWTYFFLYAASVLIFLGLEIFEYYKWNYKCTNKKIFLSLFIFRLALVLAPPLAMLIHSHEVDRFWGYQIYQSFMLMSLLPFYAYFVFNHKISLYLLIIFMALPLGYDIYAGDLTNLDLNYIGFLTYRTLTYVFFYVLAFLLDKERQNVEENDRLLKELQDSENQLREYAGRIAHTVALEERTRIARDIHDSLGHSLTAIKIQLTKAIAFASVNYDESLNAINAAKASADDAMSDIRDSLRRLNGGESAISIKTALPQFVHRLEDNGIEVNYTYEGDESGYNYSVLMGLYRFVQEGMTNILKHAHCSHVDMIVSFGEEQGSIELTDNGKGFDIKESSPWEYGTGHYGLKGLYRRMELVRGTLSIKSKIGKGTTILSSVPKDPVVLLGELHE